MATAPPENRSYAAAHFALELDGKKDVGLFRSIEGGGVKADVMTYQHAANKEHGYERWRVLGKPKFEDLKLQVGMAMSAPFYAWMKQFFDGIASRKNGAIVAADFYYKERARRIFTDALIKEITFPKLDATDKNAAYMTVAVAVENLTFERGSGNELAAPKGFSHQKLWTACNFRFSLEGFEAECRRVTKIDSFTIKQNIIEYHRGGFKAPLKTPSAVEFPNLAFYVPEADSHKFVEHMAKRVGYGTSGNGEVRPPDTIHGQIDIFDSEGRTLFLLDFYGADIISVTPDKNEASTEEIKQVKIELYTERMAIEYKNLPAGDDPGKR